MQDLITSFSGLKENVLEQYTLAKGVRDAAVDLLHTLVAVHAGIYAGCKPLLDKTLGILVEGLIDTFLSLFHENQETEFAVLDVNGFCQFMLELDYFETILTTYFTHEARESLKTLQGALLEKATESVLETIETPSHGRRSTRGNEDVLQDERQQGGAVSPDDLIALAQQYSSDLLQSELERTWINTACFVESILSQIQQKQLMLLLEDQWILPVEDLKVLDPQATQNKDADELEDELILILTISRMIGSWRHNFISCL